MVFGSSNDESRTSLGFIQAANLAGVKPDQMRRWLDKPQVRSLIATERKRFRTAICAGNEGALLEIRDKSKNDMARIASIRLLSEIEQSEETSTPLGATTPGVTIIISGSPAPNAIDPSETIAVPYRSYEPADEEEPQIALDPIFKP